MSAVTFTLSIKFIQKNALFENSLSMVKPNMINFSHGSIGVPMKSPALSNFKVDPFVFAVYTSVGIFFVSVPLIVYLLAINEFEFELWAILGAVDIVIIGDK